MNAKAVIRMPGEGKEVTLAGKPMTFLVTGDDTKHTSMFEWTLPAGFSTGLHVHRVQEETFYVLEGECEWQVGDQKVRAKPGTFLFIPPGVPRPLANRHDAIRRSSSITRRHCGVTNLPTPARWSNDAAGQTGNQRSASRETAP